MYVAWTLSTLAVAGFGLAHAPWQAMLACFLFNALETAGTIVWVTTKQRLVPRQLLGRVSSLDWFISIGLLPLSFALTGPVATLARGAAHADRRRGAGRDRDVLVPVPAGDALGGGNTPRGPGPGPELPGTFGLPHPVDTTT